MKSDRAMNWRWFNPLPATQGGLRLMQATCKRFFEYCRDHGIALDRRNFTMSYDTNIPRQVGLAGSSAIVTSALRCLMSFYKLTDSDIPKTLQVCMERSGRRGGGGSVCFLDSHPRRTAQLCA